VALVVDPCMFVRMKVYAVLCMVEPKALASHAGAMVGFLNHHTESDVRFSAVRALYALDSAAITPHAGVILGLFADSNMNVVIMAMDILGKLDSVVLELYAGAVADKLTDSDLKVRCAAVRALGKLAVYADAISHAILGILVDMRYEQRLMSWPSDFRLHLLRMFESDAMGVLASDGLALVFGALMLIQPDGFNLSPLSHATVTKILGNLKRRRARLHWATARAFVHVYLVRPYAFFWYEYAGKQLCAPGGRWAKRDRTAFEAEFNDDLCK
jgi:hypothetical protein